MQEVRGSIPLGSTTCFRIISTASKALNGNAIFRVPERIWLRLVRFCLPAGVALHQEKRSESRLPGRAHRARISTTLPAEKTSKPEVVKEW